MPNPDLWVTSWGPAILQALLVLFVFALGVPALLLQSIAPPALQRLVRKTFRYPILAVLVLAFVLLSAGLLLIVGSGWSTPVIPDNVLNTQIAPIWVGWSLVVGTLIIGVATWKYFQSFGFGQITEAVSKTATRQCDRLRILAGCDLDSRGPWGKKLLILRERARIGFLRALGKDPVSRPRRSLKKALKSLGSLGEIASSSDENRIVLGHLKKIVGAVAVYIGSKKNCPVGVLEELTRAVRRTVATPGTCARANDFVYALEVLRPLRVAFKELDLRDTQEEAVTLSAVSRIVRRLINRATLEPSSGLSSALIFAADSLESQSLELLYLGISCLNRFPVEGTLHSLSLLSNLASQPAEPGNKLDDFITKRRLEEHSAAFLGLAAVVRLHNPIAKRWVDKTLLPSVRQELIGEQSMQVVLETLFSLSEFRAAAAIENWQKELTSPATNKDERVLNALNINFSLVSLESVRKTTPKE